ncbi:MAG: glycosyltransferase family 2 protein [Pseudomonadota bacterium]
MRPTILAITTMRNEGPFILEWIAHHLALGVSDFLVFTNDCDDGTDTLLEALTKGGAVTHIRQELDPDAGSVQWQALKRAAEHERYLKATWAMAIDCDEFVVLKSRFNDLPALTEATRADAIALPWRLFGSSGHLRFADDPVTERFLRAIPEYVVFPAAARFFKTLFRVEAFERPGVHRPKAATYQQRWVDGSARALPADFAGKSGQIMLPPVEDPYGVVQLNHYSLRSAEDFLVKRRRGLPNRRGKALDVSYWAERNFNLVDERSAQRHQAARRVEAARLRALPGVSEAHAACVNAHRTRIEEVLRDPEEARLFTRLALLPSSVLPEPETARDLLEIVQRAGT